MLPFLFLDNWLILFVPAVAVQIFNTTAELVIPTGTAKNEVNAEVEKHSFTAEM